MGRGYIDKFNYGSLEDQPKSEDFPKDHIKFLNFLNTSMFYCKRCVMQALSLD